MSKLKKGAIKIVRKCVELALQLYYALQSPEAKTAMTNVTPRWAKTIIIGALGYFISPVDVVPDVIPIVGLSDDLVVLGLAVKTVVECITDEVKGKAKCKVDELFGEEEEENGENEEEEEEDNEGE